MAKFVALGMAVVGLFLSAGLLTWHFLGWLPGTVYSEPTQMRALVALIGYGATMSLIGAIELLTGDPSRG